MHHRVLVCAPSDAAADRLVLLLLQKGGVITTDGTYQGTAVLCAYVYMCASERFVYTCVYLSDPIRVCALSAAV